MQVIPVVPQCWLLLVWQVPLASQQPLAQLAGVHTQLWSGPHSVPGGHATQVTPLSPHAVLAVPAWQVPLASQQPFGQLAGVQTHEPFWHSWPAGHATHVMPLVPQCWSLLVWQVPLASQQPFGQLAGVQTQL
jgi:hypothetical protein